VKILQVSTKEFKLKYEVEQVISKNVLSTIYKQKKIIHNSLISIDL
jgi:hypothetical protein